jgi:hypothetical protein
MLAMTLFPTSVQAASAPYIRADLEGRTIKASEISTYYCHDRAFPLIHCFSTASRLEAALATTSLAAAAAFGPADYVTIYSDPSYAGSYMHLSQNYDTLFWVGWNDRVRSFKARNGAAGTFWTDWYGTGYGLGFCCDQTTPYLSATFDNAITSVYRG